MRSPFSEWRKACPKRRARSGTVRRRAAKGTPRRRAAIAPPKTARIGTSGSMKRIGAYLAGRIEKRR
jgi:hypothetical protein